MVGVVGDLEVVVGDGFDVFVVCFFVEMYYVEQVGEVGYCQGGLFIFGGSFDDVVDMYQVIYDGVF